VNPAVRVSGVDEDAVAAQLTDPGPAELVTALAKAKAEAVVPVVATEGGDTVVLGCDSMLCMLGGNGVPGGAVVGKPGTTEIAAKRWREMAGGRGELLTGHAVVLLRNGHVEARVQAHMSTTVRFGEPTGPELDAYLATGEPQQVAGGFTLDGFGGWFIEGVEGDPSSVIGLSLPLTRKLLAEVGVSVIGLWNTSA
jgi:septum formation protein